MPAVVEFGFNAAPVFTGVESIERKLRKMDDNVITAQTKLASALRNPWVSAGVDQQKYFTQLLATERQTRQIAAAHAKLASYKGPQAASAAVNPWTTAGAGQYAQQQDAAKHAAEAAAVMATQQRAAEAASAAQQKLAAIHASTQSKAMAAAAAAGTVAAAEQRSASLKTNNGRMNLALLEAQIGGNKKEAASIQNRISLMERMRTIQQQTNVSQREAYSLAQRSAGVMAGGKGGMRGMQIGMAGMQAQDIAVQMQMGTRMSTIVAQQGSQLFSLFGPIGMLVGAVVAVGGAFYTARQMGEEAFQALKKESDDFDGNLKQLKNGSLDQISAALSQMRDRAREAREAAETPDTFTRFFAKTTYDENGVATNAHDKRKRQANEEVAAKNDQGILELAKQAVVLSDRETKIAIARAAGRFQEAEQMERSVKLAQEWIRIGNMQGLSPEQRNQSENNAVDVAVAEQQKADADAAAEKQAEMDKLAAAQQRLDEQKKNAALDQMTLAQRIAMMSVDAQQALAEENRLKGAAKLDAQAIIDAESRRVGIQAQILNSQRQLATEKEREAEAAKRAAEQAARQAEQAAAAASTRRATVMDTALEYKMLEAKAAGRKKEVEEIEKQQRVLDRGRRLEQQNGLKPRPALALAIKMTDMEDRANGKRRKIRGVQTVDLDPDNRLGLSGRNGPLSSRSGPLSNGGPLSKHGGLEGFWNLQLGNHGSSHQPSQYALQNAFSTSPSLQATHQANAAAQAAPVGGGPTVDVFIEKLIQRLPPALAAAILSQT